MTKIDALLIDFTKASSRLIEALTLEKTDIIRDATSI